jgi:hypothetical protein
MVDDGGVRISLGAVAFIWLRALRARNKMKASRAERDMVASEENEPRNRRRSTATSRIPGRWSTTEEAVYRSAQ